MRRWNRHALGLITGILLILVAKTGLALDDGGGRSVFASGAGERALGMGGAYVATANDASAAIWNPGGLGAVARKQLQASHTNLFGLGFNEQYASLVIPNWRWGAGSLTFRRFGVDGIEQRDDRNVLLDDSLTDSETELLLGYGRNLGGAWNLGGTIKIQSQNLAGYSGTGIGLDLGLQVRPLMAAGGESAAAEALSLGLAIRNLIEPSIRLDQDSVPDPTGVRFGLAYDFRMSETMGLILAADVEKTSDMNTRTQLGAEFQVVRELALRVGSNAGMLAAGAGISWKDVGVNYTYEDNPLGAVSRFGVAISFGPTVDESRQAVLDAQETALQERMNSAFERNQNLRIESFVAQAESNLDSGNYTQALDVIGMLKVLAPGDLRLPRLENAAWRGRGLDDEKHGDLTEATVNLSRALAVAPDDSVSARALRRVRTESQNQAQRTEEIRRLYDDGMRAFVASELDTAKNRFESVLALAPGDEDARTMLGRTQDLLRKQDMEARLADQARIAAEEKAQRDAADRAAAAKRESRPTTPAATPVPAQSRLTAAQKREMEDLYLRGIQAAEEGRTEDAVRYWELVWSTDPGHENVADYLKREYLARGMESFAAGQLDDAVRDWERALAIDPEDARARGYLERARQQQARIREISTN